MEFALQAEEFIFEMIYLRIFFSIRIPERCSVNAPECERASDTDGTHRIEIVGIAQYFCLDRLWFGVFTPKLEVIVNCDTMLDSSDPFVVHVCSLEHLFDHGKRFFRVTAGTVAQYSMKIVDERRTANHFAVSV